MNPFKALLIRRALKHFLEGKQMQAIQQFLSGKKTYLTGLVGIIFGLVNLVGLTIPGVPLMDHAQAVQTIIGALMGIFIRNSVTPITR